jgi:hypothetical protein
VRLGHAREERHGRRIAPYADHFLSSACTPENHLNRVIRGLLRNSAGPAENYFTRT